MCKRNSDIKSWAWFKNLLLEQDGSETGVESTDTLVLQHLGEATNETVGIGGLGDETDTGSLKRAEGNVGEELGGGRGGQVDGSAVVGGSLEAELVDELGLEELITTELESTLQEVTGKGRTSTGQESASTLTLNNLAETTDETAVVGSGVELDTGLDAVLQKENVSVSHERFVFACKRMAVTKISPPASQKARANPCFHHPPSIKNNSESVKHTHRRESGHRG